MRALVTAALLATLTACGGRQVEVRSGAAPVAETSISMTNNLSQAVNVYVESAGNDILLKQVAANSTELLPVSGVATGSSVTLKARTVDGTRTYSKPNVTLTGTYNWQVP
jgi:Flp pilus assembly protein TadD